ncbi:hypothetical protein SRABI118_01394 [Massilia sp. Bi118]|nr:hypothetical protein SRABI118_01394 [Massilia sp. Bi118]
MVPGLSCLAHAASADSAANGENLLVFVGQKISLEKQPPPGCDNCIIMDEHFVANYRILDTVFGDYRANTIAFDVYDHYGTPAFSTYETVLLFVSRQPDGSWVHEKYQFYDLHQGVDAQWYGCGDPYQNYPNPPRTVKARPVEFAAPVSYPLKELKPEQIKRYYPAGYFDIRGGRAWCLKATSAADLFEAKKQTILTARGIFKKGSE